MSEILRMGNSIYDFPKNRKSRLNLKQDSMKNHFTSKKMSANKPINSIAEIEKLLSYDKPEGNGLSKIDGIFNLDNSKNSVGFKKSQYSRFI